MVALVIVAGVGWGLALVFGITALVMRWHASDMEADRDACREFSEACRRECLHWRDQCQQARRESAAHPAAGEWGEEGG